MDSSPRGLVGVSPNDPIGVVVTVGKRGKSGAPMFKDRFWMMSRMASSHEFGGERKYRALARDMDPAFAAWNERAEKGPQGVGFLRGNLVHADLAAAAKWNRSAQKLPEPHKNPGSMRPACEGNGIEAKRYAGLVDGEESFETIACPNELCEFAMAGLCKPAAHLIFRLRWNPNDPFERQFPSLLCLYSTRSWNTLRNLLGMFELVLGTEAVCPFEPRENWRTGLAQELGLREVSLVGMPFTMTLGVKTKPSEQKRFPVVSFSPDGDLVAWLVAQRQQRDAIGGGERIALKAAPIATTDDDFREIADNARVELDVASYEMVPDQEPEEPSAETLAPEPPVTTPRNSKPAHDGPVLLSKAKVDSLLRLATEHGCIGDLYLEAARIAGTSNLTGVPAQHETELLSFIRRQGKARKP